MSEFTVSVRGDLWDLVKDEMEAFWRSVQEKYSDGRITLNEIWALVSEAIQVLTKIFEKLNVDNATKREMLVALIDDTYTNVIAPLDISWVPNLFEPVLDRIIGQMVHQMAETALEYLLPDSIAPAPDATEG